MVKGKKLAAVMLAMMFTLTACGDKKKVVDDYGQVQDSDSAEDDKAPAQVSSGKKLTEMLGGDKLHFDKDFEIDSRKFNVDASVTVNETDRLSTYKVKMIDKSEINEDEIVKNILGDKAEPLNSSSRDRLTIENEDSVNLMSAIQYVLYRNGDSISARDGESPTWKEGGGYYIHVYEGLRNNIKYQLMVSYSEKHGEVTIAFFPIDLKELSHTEDADEVQVITPDGKLYAYKGSTLTAYDASEVGDGSPNRCTKTDEELVQMIKSGLKEATGLDYPEECISLNANTYEVVLTEGAKPQKTELVFVNKEKLNSGDLCTAVRDGYQTTVMYSLCGQTIMPDNVMIDYDAYAMMGSYIFVNNDGIAGMMFNAKYTFEETVDESVEVISFEDAMECAVEAMQNNLNVTDLQVAADTVNIRDIGLMYYPDPIDENGKEAMLIPVWALEIRANRHTPIARVVIDARDGSFVKIMYPEE